MIWEIVAFGDVNTLNLTFNAIASIFSDGGYKAAAVAVALFVVVGYSMKSLSDGKQELPFARLLAGIIVYSMGFNTFTSVSIENRYDSTVTKIDNIPIAIAVPASLISQVGLYLTQTVETTFGNVDSDMEKVSQSGYLSPLKLLVDFRSKAQYRCPAGETISTGNGINLCQSLDVYVSECAMVKANRDSAFLSMSEQNYMDAIQFDSEAFAAEITTDSGEKVTMSCKEAGTLIQQAFDSNTFDEMVNALHNRGSTAPLLESGISQTGDALQAIGVDSGEARNLLQTIFMRKAAENGELEFYMRTGASDLAENLSTSIEQRNFSWTLQGEMWVQIVDKFISIIECLIYAMAPIVGLMVLTGSLGAKTFLLYIQMLAVIQLMPVMQVIAQNIILADMADYANELAARYQVGSMDYDFRLLDKAKELLGLGGMISATIVPAMAMALVTGSGMAMMGAMKGAAAPPKDVDAVPDLVGQGGSTNNLGNFNESNQDQFGNRATQSTMTQAGNITNSSGFKEAVSHSHKAMQEASKNWSESNASAQQSSKGTAYSSQQLQSIGNNIVSTNNDTQAWGTKVSQQIASDTSLTKEDKAALTGALGMGLMIKNNGGNTQSSFTDGLSKNAKEAYQKILSGTYSEEMNAILADSKQALSSTGETVSTGNDYADKRLAELKTSSAEKVSTSNSYDKLKSSERSLDVKDDDLMTNMYMKAHEQGGYQRALAQADEWMSDPDSSNQYRFYTSKLDELNGGVNANNIDEKTATLMAVAITSQAFDEQGDFLKDVWAGNDGNGFFDKEGQQPNQLNDNNASNDPEYTGKPTSTVIAPPNKQTSTFTPPTNSDGEPSINPDTGKPFTQQELNTQAVEQHHSESNQKVADEQNKDSELNKFIEARKAFLEDADPYEGNKARSTYELAKSTVQSVKDDSGDVADESIRYNTSQLSHAIDELGVFVGAYEPPPKSSDYASHAEWQDKFGDIPGGSNAPVGNLPDDYQTPTLSNDIVGSLQNVANYPSQAMNNVVAFASTVGDSISTPAIQEKLESFLSEQGYMNNQESLQEALVNFGGDTGEEGKVILTQAGINLGSTDTSGIPK